MFKKKSYNQQKHRSTEKKTILKLLQCGVFLTKVRQLTASMSSILKEKISVACMGKVNRLISCVYGS